MDTTPMYTPPPWGADGANAFGLSLDVIKGGVLIESLSLPIDSTKSFVVVGRMAPRCDLVLEHPSISRVHAALQFDDNGVLFLMDLGSTHGTFINKKRLLPRGTQRLHVGDMVAFGESSRKYALCGPPDLLPEEGAVRRCGQEENIRAERRTDSTSAEDDDGASWGFREDAEEEEEDEEEENSDGDAQNRASTRRREENDLPDYLRGIKEQGRSSYTSRVSAADVSEKDQKLFQQLQAKLKKMENLETEQQRINAKQNNLQGLTEGQEKALERNAARVETLTKEIEELEERILSRSAQREQSRAANVKKTTGGRREPSSYDSDEDDFYDRTAANKKRQQLRQTSTGSAVLKAATAEVLTADSIQQRILSLEKELEVAKGEYERVDGEKKPPVGKGEEVDALDAYMQSAAQDLHASEVARLRSQSELLEKELQRQRELLAIAMPALYQQQMARQGEAESAKKEKRVQVQVAEPQPMVSSVKPVAPASEAQAKPQADSAKQTTASTKEDVPKETLTAEVSEAPQPKKRRLLGPTLPPPSAAPTAVQSSAVLEGGDRVWVPPTNQTGDGRTALNDKYGY